MDLANTISSVLTGALIIVVIIAMVDGMYIRKEIIPVEVCNGEPTNATQMYDLGFIRTGENTQWQDQLGETNFTSEES